MPGREERDHEFTHDLPNADTIRFRFNLDRGRVTVFTVQLECYVEGRWRPVVRYDDAHGRPHRDTLDWNGSVVVKDWLPAELSLNQAMNRARADLLAHHETYRAEFLGRKPR